MRLKILILLFSIASLSACYDREREERLTLRERKLLLKEKELALKEADYLSLIQMRDSLTTLKLTDSSSVGWPEDIEGYWNSKIVCTESNCNDYVVGDLRSDTWWFSSDSLQMIAKIINNNNLVRVYSATYRDDLITLKFKTDSSAAKQVDMKVLLNEITPNKIRGIRTVSIDNKCTARFNVELNRVPSKKQD